MEGKSLDPPGWLWRAMRGTFACDDPDALFRPGYHRQNIEQTPREICVMCTAMSCQAARLSATAGSHNTPYHVHNRPEMGPATNTAIATKYNCMCARAPPRCQ